MTPSINKKLADKLRLLKLDAFIESWKKAATEFDGDLGFVQTVLEALVDAQLNDNTTALQKRMRTQAKFKFPQAHVSDIDFTRQQVLSKHEVKRLIAFDWVNECAHVILVGPTGTAKTSTACAFGNALIMAGFKVLFVRFHDLLPELVAADRHEDRSVYKRVMRKYVSLPVLIIDDWATVPLTEAERRLIFDLIEQRDGKGSLIITSQYQPSEWHASFGDSTIADAVLDRIVHASNLYNFKGVESYRKLNALGKRTTKKVKPTGHKGGADA